MEDREAGQPVVVRWAKEEEWAPAMQMVWRTFLKFEGRDYTEEGIKNFFDFITDDNLYEGFLRGKGSWNRFHPQQKPSVASVCGRGISPQGRRQSYYECTVFLFKRGSGRKVYFGAGGTLCGKLLQKAGFSYGTPGTGNFRYPGDCHGKNILRENRKA